MKTIICIILSILAFVPSKSDQKKISKISEKVFGLAEEQYKAIDARLAPGSYPRTVATDGTGKCIDSGISWWCSGFFPGSLWFTYEYTKDPDIKALAEKYTLPLEGLIKAKTDHDIGFMIDCSYGNAYKITRDNSYLQTIRDAAVKLGTRYSAKTGVIRSWDYSGKKHKWQYPVIIDNMMNLELLMDAYKLFGIDSLKAIAISHADKTMANHFRSDFTTFHLVDYDPNDGHVRSKETVQGFSDSSAWARGQAWALYGYTMMADKTGERRYLAQAESIASMLLRRLPKDGIPFWDFDSDKIPYDYRDASAAAVMASAFIKLSTLTNDKHNSKQYVTMATKQLLSLASDKFLAKKGENGGFLLMHNVGNKPSGSEIDAPLSYADYYFLEALIRYGRLTNDCMFATID